MKNGKDSELDQMVSQVVAEFMVPLQKCQCGSDVWGKFDPMRIAYHCPVCGNWKPKTELLTKP